MVLSINSDVLAIDDLFYEYSLEANIPSLQYLMNNGEVTSEKLVQIYLSRIEEYDDEFNAVISINDDAIEQAKVLDEERACGNIRSPLHGVPILIKDNIDVYGLPTTVGSKALYDNFPEDSAEVVKRLENAGAIILGKTNMSEFAFSAATSISSYGIVKNSFNSDYSAYGSSGGSAVAVSLAFCTVSLGTDTNTSVRAPASANNVVGIRPTFGSIPSDGVVAYDPSRDTVGVITKYATDAKIVLELISDLECEETEYTTMINCNEFENSMNGVKIGVPNEFMYGAKMYPSIFSDTNSEVLELMLNSIELMQSYGAEIVYFDGLFNEYFFKLYNKNMADTSFANEFDKYIINNSGSVNSFSELVASNNSYYQFTLEKYDKFDVEYDENKILKARTQMREHTTNIMDENDFDFIIYPEIKGDYLHSLGSNSTMACGSYVPSLSGMPAICIPIGFNSLGLPYGMEVLGRINSDFDLLKFAEQYQTIDAHIQVPINEKTEIEQQLAQIDELISNRLKFIECDFSEIHPYDMYIRSRIDEHSDFVIANYDDTEFVMNEIYRINNASIFILQG